MLDERNGEGESGKRVLLLGIIVVISSIIGILVYYLIESGYINFPHENIHQHSVVVWKKNGSGEKVEDEIKVKKEKLNETFSQNHSKRLKVNMMLVESYDDATFTPYIRNSSDYYWGDKILIYVNVSDFGFFRGKNYKFVMLHGALEVIAPTGKRVDVFSNEHAIEFTQRVPLKSKRLPFILTIDTNYPQLEDFGLKGRYKVVLKITDDILEETKTKTIYFNLKQ